MEGRQDRFAIFYFGLKEATIPKAFGLEAATQPID